MLEKIFLNLFILCGILSQGIIRTFLEENYQNSSNLHFRKKRLVYHSSEYRELSITDVPYIVKILQNGTKNCAGIIVSPIYILTAKVCVDERNAVYTVESGELFISAVQIHRPLRISYTGHLALVRIIPIITINHPSGHRKILLFEGPLPTHTVATISGMGPTGSRRIDGMEAPNFRQLTNVPIINLDTCFDYYNRHNYAITSENICTLESCARRGCTHEDAGSALVADEKLVGVLIFAGSILGEFAPDVFIRVNDNNTYHRWIMSHIELHSPNPLNRRFQQPSNRYSGPYSSHYRHTSN